MIKNGVALKDSFSKTKVVLETITVENKSKKVETNFVENVLKASFVSFTWKEVQQFKIRQVCCVFRPAKKYTTKYVVYFDVCWSKYRYHQINLYCSAKTEPNIFFDRKLKTMVHKIMETHSSLRKKIKNFNFLHHWFQTF